MQEIIIIFAIFFFIFGLVFGSFINVLIFRLYKNESIIFPSSHCPKCKKPLKAIDNIPLISYIFLKGKCRFCKEKISVIYPIVEFLTGLSFLVTFLNFGLVNINFDLSFWTNVVIYSFIFAAIIFFSFYDILYYEINDKVVIFVIPLLILVNVGFYFFPYLNINGLWFNSTFGLFNLGAALLLALIFVLIIVLSKGKMGGGDIRFALIMGLTIGLKPLYLALMSASIVGSVIGIIMALKEKRFMGLRLPFIPLLSVGLLVGLFWGEMFFDYLFAL